MKKYFVYRTLVASILSCGLVACNSGQSTDTKQDTLPGVIHHPITDSDAIKRTPPTHDSNAVITDSTGVSR